MIHGLKEMYIAFCKNIQFNRWCYCNKNLFSMRVGLSFQVFVTDVHFNWSADINMLTILCKLEQQMYLLDFHYEWIFLHG